MELVFISHGNIFDLHYLATWLSIVIVVGGFYGAIRLLLDLWRWGRKPYISGRSREIAHGELKVGAGPGSDPPE